MNSKEARQNTTRVAVVISVLNERSAITQLLFALAVQTRLPDEVLIADGCSTDGTVDAIHEVLSSLPFPVIIIPQPGNISKGRNAAIQQCSADIIAVTDAGCVPHVTWLEQITAPIREGRVQAVAGAYRAAARTPLERAIAVFSWVDVTRPGARFRPSHRSVAYLREVWKDIGGYQENLDSAEDTLFDIEVERRFAVEAVPRAIVDWHPRSSFRGALRQQLFYGTGDGRGRIMLRYHVAVGLFVVAEILVLIGSGYVRLLAGALLAAASFYFIAKTHRLFERMALASLPFVILLMFALPPARLFGFFIGISGNKMLSRG
uniref:Putative Glycosyltransferase n=1 Tax=mine drainage metagenome TaxID=410659 RepID=E6Q5Z3_9ZZZZ